MFFFTERITRFLDAGRLLLSCPHSGGFLDSGYTLRSLESPESAQEDFPIQGDSFFSPKTRDNGQTRAI